MKKEAMVLEEETIFQLIHQATLARQNSYSPYSDYMVGAALLCEDGEIFTGCNIENASFSPTNCAERTAFFKAVSEGKREFTAIAVVGGKRGEKELDMAYPCGVCRQVMREFCNEKEFIVITAKDTEYYKKFYLKELLPDGFGPENVC